MLNLQSVANFDYAFNFNLQCECETGGRKAMIFSSIQSKKDLARYPTAIQKAILYAAQINFDALEDGRQEIDGDRMFANLFHLTSQSAEEVSREGHKEYVDVQFWLSGEEWCGVAPRTGKEICVEAHEDKDLYFFNKAEGESYLYARPGCYAVFFPDDLHRPGICVDGKPMKYRKVVVKVRLDLL